MSKGLGSNFSITQWVHWCFSKQICYGTCFVSILAHLSYSLMQYLLLYYHEDLIMHVSVLCTVTDIYSDALDLQACRYEES